ncbi:MAG TPA: extracellular solute-binding protein [Xanthobacteraceae bacterium]|jgi:ABC-type Fe3+ transport system substrate-binding protein|nr:extracellular solute-binding protein [Xanthobacteraceae bacterium]
MGSLTRFAAILAGMAAALCGAAARAQNADQLYEKAKEERTLVLYSGGPAEPYERMAKEFGARYPGIAVFVTGGFSNVLDRKIDEQLAAHKLEVDMAFFQTVQDFVAWKKQGVLAPFKPDGYDKIDPRFRDADGAFTPTSVVLLTYAYNTKLVAPADVPKSALDFLKPQFAGKLVTAYPADDDATLYVFDTIIKQYGSDYMEKYMAQKPNFIQGHLAVLRSVADGNNVATFDSTSSTTGALKKMERPIEFAFPERDQMPTFFITAGIFKDAPHLNAAKLFLDWYMAKEQQSRLGTYSARTDVDPPAGLKPLSAYNIAAGYLQFVSDTERLAALRQKMEGFTGPVVNKGGVR